MKTFAVLLPILSLAMVGHAGQTNEVHFKQGHLLSQELPPVTQAPEPADTNNLAPYNFRLHLDGASPETAAPFSQSGAAVSVSSTNSTKRLLRTEPTYTGVLPDLRRKKAQFFHPPPSPFGTPEFHNVSINPITGRAEGIILFSVGF